MTKKKKEFDRWAEELTSLLADLSTMDLGYELGANIVRQPAKTLPRIPAQLEPLYAVCDGVSMPDMHVGYFIDNAQRVSEAASRGEPVTMSGASTRAIAVFGSDGGGSRFALSLGDGAIFYLPLAGVEKRQFVEDELVSAHRIAASVIEFLELVNADVRAFVRGDRAHRYVVDHRFKAP